MQTHRVQFELPDQTEVTLFVPDDGGASVAQFSSPDCKTCFTVSGDFRALGVKAKWLAGMLASLGEACAREEAKALLPKPVIKKPIFKFRR